MNDSAQAAGLKQKLGRYKPSAATNGYAADATIQH